MTTLLRDAQIIPRWPRPAGLLACVAIALSLPAVTARAHSIPRVPDATDVAPQVEDTSTETDATSDPFDQSEGVEQSAPVSAVGPAPEAPADVAPDEAAEDEAEAQPKAARSTAALPDSDTLRRLVSTDPAALASLSIGRPDAGALVNAVPMPESPLWRVRDPRRAWASQETADFLAAAIQAVEKAHPGSPPILIGDMSLPRGGAMGRHRSHESGRDVDIGWYFADGPARHLRRGKAPELDLPRCWALVRALITETDVERIFMDRRIQRVLYRYASEAGENQDWLLSLFANVSGSSDALIEHERGHHNHMHVRLYNPRAQQWGRAAYPYLVEAGLAPKPVVNHKPRRGETLSVIARRYGTTVRAIRAANGLRSTFIRAGRRYRIPVLHAETPTAPPLVVPPRRLPPPATATLLDSAE